MPKNNAIRSVLLIGSGPIIIGQACEFDYSGSQASRALRDEGIEVSLINSNPATIMTDNVTADHVYLRPLTTDSLIEILEERPIDAVLPTMGGQTGLNLCKEADELGIWQKYGVKMIGVDMDAIDRTENREAFRQLMADINVKVAPSRIANSILEGKEIAQELGYPLVVRPSYTLGGSGGSFVHNKDEFDEKVERGLKASPMHEVLIDKAVLGWKEFELELLRDNNDNVAIICTVENLDPMGIHTGDSITIAPSMTLSDTAFQDMRNKAINMMRSLGNFSGGCNVQFALNPENEEIIAIEINPRVSRSSALASKATGYPIAKVAAKLAIGYNLDELKNQITQTTSAYFEPSLDYVVTKIPRWNLDKFYGTDTTLGLQMKSVGEVMAIGRSFQESLQKACQSLENNRIGLGADKKEWHKTEDILHGIKWPSDDRIFRVKDAIKLGVPLQTVQSHTQIDQWFLRQIQDLVNTENKISNLSLSDLDKETILSLKQKGYSDAQLANVLSIEENDIYQKRKELGIRRVYKMVDTCAAEFEAQTPYYYSTFESENESIVTDRKKVLILGSGPNRIGQGIEFDYCCVHGVIAAKEQGYETIMVNCNPETVSTDFDVADKLYFEPVYWEHIREIIDHEQPEGVIVQLGGQTALKLADNLYQEGVKIFGTSFENMDRAEDRGAFSDLLKELDIPYPKYDVAETAEEALQVVREVGYPVLVRPSYVLGGQRMRIVINDEDLERTVLKLLKHLPGNRILLDHFLDRSEEAEIDAICDGEDVQIMGIMEHIEPAGIHSGDSSSVLPPFGLSEEVIETMRDYTRKLAFSIGIRGLINIQFAVKDNTVYVIEANPRASRTMPFIAKAYGVPYLNYATKVMLGEKKLKDFDFPQKMQGYAIKEPVFSFDKFPDIPKELGPEMKSTGESIRFIVGTDDPYFREMYKEKSMYLSK